jgi:hypothetical protein
MTPKEPTSTFWSWFLTMEKKLRHTSDMDLVDLAYEKLRRIHKDLAIEMGGHPDGPSELIISAQAQKELFPLVDKVIAQAPSVPGWKFIALKPAQGFDFEIEYEGERFDPREMWFDARGPRDAPGMLGLLIFIPGYDDADDTRAVSALWKLLQTGIGERSFGEMIHYVEPRRLPADPEKEHYIPLVELAGFIEHYKRKKR